MPICWSGLKNRRAYSTAATSTPTSMPPSSARRPPTSSTVATVTLPIRVSPVSKTPFSRIDDGVGAAVVLRQLAVDAAHLRLAAERLHRTDARHRLDEPHDQPRRRRPLLAVLHARADLEPPRQDDARHHRDEQDEPAAPVEDHERDRGEHHRQHAGRQRGHAAVEELAQRVHVGGLPGDDPARGVALVELEAEALRVPEHPAAQVQQHRLAHPGRRADGRGGQQPAQHRRRQVGGGRQRDRSGVAVHERRKRLVDAVGHERRTCDRGQLCADHERGRRTRRAGDRAEQGPEQAERAPTDAPRLGRTRLVVDALSARPRRAGTGRRAGRRAHGRTSASSSDSVTPSTPSMPSSWSGPSSADSAVSTYR